ncbi:MAG TPA: acyl-CoA dehydrogenase family protein [Acidimicrobiia bacterium]|nr:acyl-CoA dehydrogenase family protein [Acidimicrobiia bacterium]
MSESSDGGLESLADFGERARAWIEENLPPAGDESVSDHDLQATIFDAGFAGIAFPKAYGGAGLTLEHQKVFFDTAESMVRRVPAGYMVSIGMLGPTLLDHASETLKLRHLPRILRGDEEWMQLLSEPSGGSDMAGALTRLTRDGDTYVLNGSKMWSTGAARADYGLCLARTDWDAPKHRGLSTIAVPLKDTPGLTIDPIRSVSGLPGHFCTEFFDSIVLPAENLVGDENAGWAVAQALLYYERLATANAGHGYGLGMGGANEAGFGGRGVRVLIDAARDRNAFDAGAIRQEIADAYIERTVARYAGDRVMTGQRTGHYKGQWGSLLKLHLGADSPRQAKIGLSIHGADGVIWDGDEQVVGNAGELWLNARGISIAGGSNEMQRNIVSERLLGLPREPSFDRDIPFNEVLRNRANFKT